MLFSPAKHAMLLPDKDEEKKKILVTLTAKWRLTAFWRLHSRRSYTRSRRSSSPFGLTHGRYLKDMISSATDSWCRLSQWGKTRSTSHLRDCPSLKHKKGHDTKEKDSPIILRACPAMAFCVRLEFCFTLAASSPKRKTVGCFVNETESPWEPQRDGFPTTVKSASYPQVHKVWQKRANTILPRQGQVLWSRVDQALRR